MIPVLVLDMMEDDFMNDAMKRLKMHSDSPSLRPQFHMYLVKVIVKVRTSWRCCLLISCKL